MLILNDSNFRTILNKEIRRLGVDGDLNHLDVSRVTTMAGAFAGTPFQGNISRWDVSGVTNMASMFGKSRFNGDIAQWNVANLRNMEGMFAESLFQGDVSAWDTARVINMRSTFSESVFNGDINKWDVQNVQTFENMFFKSRFKGDISTWQFANVANVEKMFFSSPWRGTPGNLRYRQGLEFAAFFHPDVAHEFSKPNFYHWFLALSGYNNLHLDWLMLAALMPCKDADEVSRGIGVLQQWWEHGTREKHDAFEYPFEAAFQD